MKDQKPIKDSKVTIKLPKSLLEEVKKVSGKKDPTKIIENLLKEELEIQNRILLTKK